MSFSHPAWLNALYLAPVLAIIFLFGAKQRRRDLVAFAGLHFADALAPGGTWRKGLLKSSLRVGGYVLLVLGLAGPQLGSQLVKVEREGIDLVIALDTSLSMLAEDMKPNRLERAKQEIMDLVDGLKGDRVGIVVFAGDAFVLCPLTVDYNAALMFAQTADIDLVSEPGTAIGKAIEKSVALFPEDRESDRVVILVTDGESHEDDPVGAAETAAREDIRIYTIGIGNPSGELIPIRGTDGSVDGYKKDSAGETVLTRLDEATLERIAKVTGGQYLPATREGLELKVLYKEISGLDKQLVEGEFVEAKKDRFVWFLAAALLFLGADLLITARTFKGRAKRRILHTGAAGLSVALIVALMPPSALAKRVDGKRVKSGNRYFENGEYQKALVLYKEAVGDTTRLPGNAEGVLYNEANSLHMMGRYTEALEKFHQSLSEDTLQSGRMFYNRGNTLMKMGKPGEAAESYLQALNYIPDDLDARYNLELALRELDKQRQQQQQQQQQQQNDEKSQDQNQDGEQQQGDEKNESSGEQDQQNQKDQQNPADQQNQQEQQEPQKQDQRDQQPQSAPDSTQAQQPDSSMAQPQAADSTQTIELTREDALRLLRLLAEQEKELQKEKRKAAFKRSRGSGKDW